jgi:hypothetical protein
VRIRLLKLKLVVAAALATEMAGLGITPNSHAASFIGAAPLSHSRYSHTATSLADGNHAELAAATNRNLILTNIQLNDAGKYSVVVADVSGSATSRVATLANS